MSKDDAEFGTPMMAIVHKMRLDGCSEALIATFKGEKPAQSKESAAESQRALALEMGLKPKEPLKPQRVARLKRMHWKVVGLQSVKGTVWERLAKQHSDTEVPIDAKFELQFQVRSRKPNKLTLNATARMTAEHSAKGHKRKVKWLAPKRDQMIQIGLHQIGLTNDALRRGLSEMDSAVLCESRLSTLYDLLPKGDEQRKWEEKTCADDELAMLGVSELFLLSMGRIPLVAEQTSAWLFALTFKEVYTHRQQQIALMLRASKKIKISKALHGYLRVLLAVGNLMNHGSDKGCAYGFKMDHDCLSMLEGIKDFSGKKSLAMFVYEFAFNEFEVTHTLDAELQILRQAVRLETNAIEQNLKDMLLRFDGIECLCRRLVDEYAQEQTCVFRDFMHKFVNSERAKLCVLRSKLKNAKSIARAVCKYYGYTELAEQDRPEELFKVVQGFVDTMQKAKRALFELEKERMKVRAKREREREKMKKKRLKENVKRLKSQRVQPPPSMAMEESVETPLAAHFRKKTLKFQSQTLEIADRLNTTFQEKQSFAKGQLTESLKRNHIKHQSLVNLLGVVPSGRSTTTEHKCRKHKKHKKKHKKRRRRTKEYASGVDGVPMLNV